MSNQTLLIASFLGLTASPNVIMGNKFLPVPGYHPVLTAIDRSGPETETVLINIHHLDFVNNDLLFTLLSRSIFDHVGFGRFLSERPEITGGFSAMDESQQMVLFMDFIKSIS